MKKYILFMTLFSSLFAFDKDDIDNKFKEILQERKVMDKSVIYTVSDPMYRAPIRGIGEGAAKMTFSLSAIVDDRAKINGKWYSIREKVDHGFRLIKIEEDLVGLTNYSRYIELNLKDNKNVKIDFQ